MPTKPFLLTLAETLCCIKKMKIIIIIAVLLLKFDFTYCQSDTLIRTVFDSTIQVINYQTYHFDSHKDSIVFSQMFPDNIAINCSKVVCEYSNIEIIDSVDLNKDGEKEVIFKRNCFCYTEPIRKTGVPLSIVVIGSINYSYGKYEVWDLNTKKMIFEFQDKSQSVETISTSGIISDGYKYYVKVKKNGTFITSNLRNGNTRKRLKIEMVKYKFKDGEYKKTQHNTVYSK